MSSCYGTLVCVAIGDSTCNACHHMVYTGQPSIQGTTWSAFHFFEFLSNDDGQCLSISLAFENPLSITLSLYPRLFKWWRKSPSLCLVVSTVEHIRFTIILMAWLNGILLKQCLGWQLLGERYWCLSVGLEYKSVVMLPSVTVVVVSRKDNLVFYTSCVNFIDGWILFIYKPEQWKRLFKGREE